MARVTPAYTRKIPINYTTLSLGARNGDDMLQTIPIVARNTLIFASYRSLVLCYVVFALTVYQKGDPR